MQPPFIWRTWWDSTGRTESQGQGTWCFPSTSTRTTASKSETTSSRPSSSAQRLYGQWILPTEKQTLLVSSLTSLEGDLAVTQSRPISLQREVVINCATSFIFMEWRFLCNNNDEGNSGNSGYSCGCTTWLLLKNINDPLVIPPLACCMCASF